MAKRARLAQQGYKKTLLILHTLMQIEVKQRRKSQLWQARALGGDRQAMGTAKGEYSAAGTGDSSCLIYNMDLGATRSLPCPLAVAVAVAVAVAGGSSSSTAATSTRTAQQMLLLLLRGRFPSIMGVSGLD